MAHPSGDGVRHGDPVETEEVLVITKDVSVVRNDDIIDFMEVFYNVSRGQDHTPQKTFDGICRSASDVPVLFKVISVIGWTNIAVTILNRQDELPYYSAGVTLAAFAINYMNQVTELKLPRVILDQGTECLKQLTEMRIDEYDLNAEQKESEKIWWKTFLDIWKEYTKRCLEEDGAFAE